MPFSRYNTALALLAAAACVQAQEPPANPTAARECSDWWNAAFGAFIREADARSRQCGKLWVQKERQGLACMDQHHSWHQSGLARLRQAREACMAKVAQRKEQDAFHARIAAQNEQNARAAQEQLERQRITTIPVQPVPQRQRQVVIPNQNSTAARQQQAEQVAAAVGSILSRVFEAGVEKEMERGAPNEVSRRVEDHNSRALQIFNAAQERLRIHPVVQLFQNMAFEQLNNQVRVVTEQMSTLSDDIQKIIASTPEESAVLSAPNAVVKQVRMAQWDNDIVTYKGQVDDQGNPHGLGWFEAKSDRGWPTKQYGYFVAGRSEGWGTYEDTDDIGVTVTVQARWSGVDTVGVVRETTRSKDGRTSVYHGPDPQKQKDGSVAVGRIHFTEGTKFEGEIKFGGQAGERKEPAGLGVYEYRGGQVVGKFDRFNVENAEVRTGGVRIKCQKAIASQRPHCIGPARWEYPDGSFKAAPFYEKVDLDPAGVIFYHPGGNGRPSYIDEFSHKINAEKDVRRRTWNNGSVYEGEFRRGKWGDFTVGVFTHPSGIQHVGKFVNDELSDGYSVAPDGVRRTVGNGTEYALPDFRSVASK